ncbi:MAG: hypothetical protein MK098_06210 [Marinovum sp.]|nr:hypothetical protein [Marinovum sp.]
MPKIVTSAALVLALAPLASAQSIQERATDKLLDLIALPQTIEIMRDEGIAYGIELGHEMLPSEPGALWQSTLEHIYDPERMEETVRAGFAKGFLTNDVSPDKLERFFGSEMGRDIIRLEVSAREAMSDEAIEAAARDAYLELAESDAENARLALVHDFVDGNDLIEANVVGGLNTTVRFYQGLVDGGAMAMSLDDILTEVWGTEADTRKDTIEWINGFLLMAYKPLSDGQLADYMRLTQTPEGKVMNRALFLGFDAMYADVSYALGLAIAQQMNVQEL